MKALARGWPWEGTPIRVIFEDTTSSDDTQKQQRP